MTGSRHRTGSAQREKALCRLRNAVEPVLHVMQVRNSSQIGANTGQSS